MQLNESLVGLTKRGIRVGIAVAVASICVLSPYSVSHAQDDGTEVKGSLSYKDESGQKTGAEGVLMTATDEAGDAGGCRKAPGPKPSDQPGGGKK